MSDEKGEKRIIYYDGNCPMCNVFADTVSKNDKSQILVDANKENKTSISKENLLKEIHLFDGKTLRTGPDAIFTSLAQIYPILKPVAFAVRLPLVGWLAGQVYFFISKRRLLFFGGDTARLYWLFLITNIGLLTGILLSWPAWQNERIYPLSPIISGLDWLNPFTLIFATILTLSLFISVWQKQHFRLFALISLVSLIPLVLLDITRLQPWILHYSAMLFLLTQANILSTLRTIQILDAARFIVVGIYFWSGVQKMNTAFITEIFPWFSKPLWSPFGDQGASMAFIVGMLIPFIEASFAVGLLTKRFRTISIIGSGLMLTFITLSLMLGHGWNSVVWPWNFAIFTMVIVLFYGLNDTLPEILNRTKKNILAIITIAFFLLMPTGNFFGEVDHYLSWSLYSGHVPVAYITTSNQTMDDLLARTKPYNNNWEENYIEQISVVNWSVSTMNVVPYPQERVFFNIFNNLCQTYQDPNLILTIDTRPRFLSHKQIINNYTCEEVSLLMQKK
ncbi:MAG: DUF393 domain-containing protein [Candidatus Pacebacteria bacterium]|nr:DUF393 domain-containing protein [Candidatus Paceibacterota bacterium]